MGSAFSSGKASRVRSLPLVSSSPIESSPTRGSLILSTVRAYISPITANCARFCGLQSTLAPTSSSTHGLPEALGMGVASAGRSTPGQRAQHHLGRGHGRAGVARGHKARRLALAHQLQPHAH